MKKCRSIWRAMRRGHFVDFATHSYRSRAFQTQAKAVYNAMMKKKEKEKENVEQE